MGITQTMDNFPSFDEGISGSEFADRLGRQARRFGAEIITQEAVNLVQQGPYVCAITAGDTEYGANAILVIGGGNSGFEEGLFLTRYARQVDIVEHNAR